MKKFKAVFLSAPNCDKNLPMTYDNNNIFAKIIRGEIPCDKVFENDHVLAFRDINPLAPVHVLVIPKGAYTDLYDFSATASAEEIHEFHKAIKQIADELGLVEKGFRAIANTGEHGGQEVPHYHLHILGGELIGKMRG